MRGGAVFPVRLRWAKRGKVRWISHRDVARAFERAFRIEQLPLAFSAGYSPHPKVSFGLALPTGAESDAEYLDVELVREVDLATLPSSLTTALPSGMAALDAVALSERAPALQDAVTVVEWELELAPGDGVIDPSTLRHLVGAALDRAALPTTRHRKGREIVEDVRPVILAFDGIEAAGRDGAVRAHLELATQPRSAKPDEVLAAITGATGGEPLVLRRALRTRQWIERDGARLHPLVADTRTGDVADAPTTREGTHVRTDPRDHPAGAGVGVATRG
jgi:radical SAM-linked protein